MAGSETNTTSSAPVLAAVASLQTYSSALSAFTSAWRTLYSDATGLDSTLASRLHGFSELELLCSAMDGPGLRAYLTQHRDEVQDPARALDAALLLAPDPGLLVLAAASGFCRAPAAEGGADGDAKVSCRLLIDLLDRLRALGVKPSPEAREEGKAVAADWKRSKRIGVQAVFKKETVAFLLLVGVFGLVDDVGGVGEVLDLVVSVSGRERAVDAFQHLGLDLDKHMPVLLHRMVNSGKQLEAVKFIQALNLVHKYPLLPVLRSYISDAAKAGNLIRIRGDDSACQDAADAKERTMLGALQKFIKDQKLEELPILEETNKRIAQMDKKSAVRKRVAEAAKEVSKNIQKQQKLQHNLQSTNRAQLPENAAKGSLSQNSVDTRSQQLMSRQSIGMSGVPNPYQVSSSKSISPDISPSLQLVARIQRSVGVQHQAPMASSVKSQYNGLADYYGLANTGSYRPDSLAPGPSAPGAYVSSRSKLYSADPLEAVSRASDKKGSSYSYSLSNMSTYNP